MAYFEIEGFDEVINELEMLSKKAEELDGEHEVPLDELFDSSFMGRYTQFSSFDDLLDTGGFIVNNQEDFNNPDGALDNYISSTTSFKNWEDMMGKATQVYLAKRLGFDD